MNEKKQTHHGMRYIETSIAILLLAHSALAIILHDIGNAVLYLMVVLSLLLLAFRRQPENAGFKSLFFQYWPLHLAMASLFLSVLLNQMHSGNFSFKYYDRSIRLAIFPLIFWLMFFVPLHRLKWMQWGFVIAAFLAAIKAYVLTEGGTIRNGNVGFLSIIAYSDIALLTGLLALLSSGWNKRYAKGSLILKTAACAAGIYTTILSATRGSLLALPVFVIFFLFFTKIRIWHKWWPLLAAVLVATTIFFGDSQFGNRVDDIPSDVSAYYSQTNKDTSVGQRLQLWNAALKLFAEEPVFGIGRENYNPSIKKMAEKGEVTQSLTLLAHSHNEILFNMAISGVFGLVASLALYLGPGYYFWFKLGHANLQVRTAARMGCTLVLAFFAFGLTDLMFFWTVLGGYYTLMTAALLVCMIKQERQCAGITSP